MAGYSAEEYSEFSEFFLTESNTCLAVNRTSAINEYVNMEYQFSSCCKSDQEEMTFCSILNMGHESVETRCGPEAKQYVTFLWNLVIASFVVMLISLIIILPINMQGSLQELSIFSYTTMSNLEPQSTYLWAHISISWLFFLLSISTPLFKIVYFVPSSCRTIMIRNITKKERNISSIQAILQKRYQLNIPTKDINLAHKIKKLTELVEQKKLMGEAKGYCNEISRDIRRRHFWLWSKEEALEYYTKREQDFSDKVEQERNKTKEDPLGIAFVTLDSEDTVKKLTTCCGSCDKWDVTLAEPASNIIWENLETSLKWRIFMRVVVYVSIFLLIFFFDICIHIFDFLKTYFPVTHVNPIVLNLVALFVYSIYRVLTPLIIRKSELWALYWTKSKNRNLLVLAIFYMVLISIDFVLPALGLTDRFAFTEFLKSTNHSLNWNCAYVVDKSFFFFMFVIEFAFTSIAIELLHIWEFFCYIFTFICVKSEAEEPSIRKNICGEFQYAAHACNAAVVFNVCFSYCLMCPLITIVCFIYVSIKYCVDKYNICNFHKRGCTSQVYSCSVHTNFVMIFLVCSFLLQQIFLVGFLYIRTGTTVMFWVSLSGGIIIYVAAGFVLQFRMKFERLKNNYEYVAPILNDKKGTDGQDICVIPIDPNCSDA
ncbi:calcium permeable stress-gated cation channel 1-like isoform X2 [Zophobas morio]|uniref:calcium permeable stress-gated cation channel 1-like isoform X2 n=1 Tax=Zophobas morio TaxID=2755281 RepID=UPI003082C5D5